MLVVHSHALEVITVLVSYSTHTNRINHVCFHNSFLIETCLVYGYLKCTLLSSPETDLI